MIALEEQGAQKPVWPLGEALRSEGLQVVEDLHKHLAGQVPTGPWSDAPHSAVVIPIRSNRAHFLSGFLVVGISARLQLDQGYRDFLELVASQIATAITQSKGSGLKAIKGVTIKGVRSQEIKGVKKSKGSGLNT